jgi:hypothetical protein
MDILEKRSRRAQDIAGMNTEGRKWINTTRVGKKITTDSVKPAAWWLLALRGLADEQLPGRCW